MTTVLITHTGCNSYFAFITFKENQSISPKTTPWIVVQNLMVIIPKLQLPPKKTSFEKLVYSDHEDTWSSVVEDEAVLTEFSKNVQV